MWSRKLLGTLGRTFSFQWSAVERREGCKEIFSPIPMSPAESWSVRYWVFPVVSELSLQNLGGRGLGMTWERKAVGRNVTWDIQPWTGVPFRLASLHKWDRPVCPSIYLERLSRNVLLAPEMLGLNLSLLSLQLPGRPSGTCLWLPGSSGPARILKRATESPLAQPCETWHLIEVQPTDHWATWPLATYGGRTRRNDSFACDALSLSLVGFKRGDRNREERKGRCYVWKRHTRFPKDPPTP